MLSVTQIHRVIENELRFYPLQAMPEAIAAAAEKIYDLVKPDHTIHVAAAALENEITSTLINMTAATILGTLINEEGGGRTNIRISSGSMQEILSDWNYTVEMEGLVRNVRITPKNADAWEVPDESYDPAKAPLASLLMTEASADIEAKPQAEPHEYNRPVWAVAVVGENGTTLMICHDRADAGRQYRKLPRAAVAHIENRWCLHPDCPSTGCNHDASKRDSTEVASDE